MKGYSFQELVKLAEAAVKRAGDTMTGNLTVPKVLVSGAQGTEVNALTRKDYVDSAIAAGDALQVSKAGDTMTGNLTTPKVLVSGAQGTEINALTRKDYVDSAIAAGDALQVSKSGDTMTGNLTAPAVLVSSAQNTSVNALTRKDYVDQQVATRAPTTHSHTAADVGAVPATDGTAENARQVTPKNQSWGSQTQSFLTGSTSAPAGSGRTEFVDWIQWGHNGGQKIRHTIWCPADNSKPTELWFASQNNTTNTDGPATHWRIYHQGFKPTPADIDAVAKSGDTMTGNLTVPKVLVSGAQGAEGNALTRKDYVDSQVATRAPTNHTHTVSAITDLRPQEIAATANTLVLRDGSADVNARLLRTTYQDQSDMSGALVFRYNNSTDNYNRYCSNPGAVRDWMKGAKTNWDMGWRAYIEHSDNPMTEYHIPGKTAVLTYLAGDGNYRISSSNGAGGAVAERLRLDPSGNLFATAAIYEAGQRVYGPNNPQKLAQGGSGSGGTSVTFSTAGKTMAVAYLVANSRVYPVTFAIASAVQHGVNVLNRGGENADRDHDLRVAVSVSGTNMTLTTIAGNRCNGIWQVYTM